MTFGTSNFDRQGMINNTVALAKASRVFDVPWYSRQLKRRVFRGNLWPQLRAVFPGQEPIERSSMNSWDDKKFVAAIEKTGRKKIVLAGYKPENCVALPTIQAIPRRLRSLCAGDCCGDVSQLAHDNAMKRVIQSGAKPVTSLSTMLEWQRDWAHRETYDAMMDIVKTHYGAYGIGVEYAYTMVHGAPPTKFPEYVVPTAARSLTSKERRGQKLALHFSRSLENWRKENRMSAELSCTMPRSRRTRRLRLLRRSRLLMEKRRYRGDDQEILRLRGPATRVIDGQGRTIIPGLNDSHMHPIRGGLNYNLELRWDRVPLVRRCTAHAQRAGGADAGSAVGASHRRMDGVSVRRRPDAYAGRNQRSSAGHSCLRDAFVR